VSCFLRQIIELLTVPRVLRYRHFICKPCSSVLIFWIFLWSELSFQAPSILTT